MSISAYTTSFGMSPVKEIDYCEDIDERLFDEYLTISEAPQHHTILSSPLDSEEESDASSMKKCPIVSMNKQSKSNHRKPRSRKKEDDQTKVYKNNNKKSSTASSVISQESNESDKKQKSLYKTELCRNWEETSHCRYGVKCQYAHGASDLREIDRHPKYKTQKCRTFHQTGSCPYGARCTFRHFNLPGDALEMKNLDRQEEEEQRLQQQQQQQQVKEHQEIQSNTKEERPSVFAVDNRKNLQQNWFHQSHINHFGHTNDIPKRNLIMNQLSSGGIFDPEDSLLPSNAESLLPHQLLFDLESPEDEEEKPARCPLRNYVNLPSLSNFQVPYHPPIQQQQQPQQQECKTFFRPWLF